MRGLKHWLGISGAAAVAAVAACASDPTDDSAAKAEEAFATDFCDIVNEDLKLCCVKALNIPTDKEACKKAVAAIDPVMVREEKARADCLAQLRAASPLNDFCTDFGNLDIPACPDARRKVNLGMVKPAEPCTVDADCAPSYEGTVACKGVCQVTKRGKAGDGPCVATVEANKVVRPQKAGADGPVAFVCYMRDSLSCDTATKTCIKPADIGGDCTDDDSCIRTAHCDETTKKCVIRKSRGSACTKDGQCQANLNCDETFCRDDADEGAPCERAETCSTGLCGASKTCEKPGIDTRLENVCKAPPPPPP